MVDVFLGWVTCGQLGSLCWEPSEALCKIKPQIVLPKEVKLVNSLNDKNDPLPGFVVKYCARSFA